MIDDGDDYIIVVLLIILSSTPQPLSTLSSTITLPSSLSS